MMVGLVVGSLSIFAYEVSHKAHDVQLIKKIEPNFNYRPKAFPKHVQVKDKHKEYYVEERQKDLKFSNCSQCHLNEIVVKEDHDWNLSPHGNMNVKHASIMNCKTCHDYQKPDSLKLINDKSVSMNHSYQLCSQCHHKEYEDWKGGAHGKRLNYWAGKRVIKNCTSCHNAHHPAIDPRLPVMFPQIPRL